MEGATRYKLEIRNARKVYGPIVALTDANLQLAEGEFLTLLGPSGSGKTTLLMIVAGLVQPDAGEIWIGGNPATHLPSFKRDIGMVFQNYALFPHLTVFENIAFPLRMRKVREAEITQKVGSVLEMVGLAQTASRFPRQLSGGQQQRIALARCIVYQPSIILMDEPLGALDRKLRERMQLEIKQLHQQLGITVLYVTHDQEEAMVMSDRICLMRDAMIEQIGSPQQLYFSPRSVFAARFLGDSNIFDATVLRSQAGATTLRLATGDEINAPIAQVSVGTRLKLLVRPERIRILQGNEDAPNRVNGIFRASLLVGGITRYLVHLDGHGEITAAALTSNKALKPATGTIIALGWSAEDTVILREE